MKKSGWLCKEGNQKRKGINFKIEELIEVIPQN